MILGKSTLSCMICKEFSKMKKKTLIVDFDVYNKSISILYNTFSKKIDYEKIENNIIKVSKYEHLLFVEESFLQSKDIFNTIKKLKNEYEQIIIDTSSNIKSQEYKRILEISDDIIFIVIPSVCELKKSIKIFEILKEDYKIPLQKIRFVINKQNSYSVDNLIIQKIFGAKKINRKYQI